MNKAEVKRKVTECLSVLLLGQTDLISILTTLDVLEEKIVEVRQAMVKAFGVED